MYGIQRWAMCTHLLDLHFIDIYWGQKVCNHYPGANMPWGWSLLGILRMCVTILNVCVKSLWPFWDVCAFSASMWSFSMPVWSHSDHFGMSVHPQYVCDHPQCLCEVTLTILGCLCILREYVIILNACVKSLWPFWDVCASLGCMWSFSMPVWSHSDHFGMSVHP
jgi:hypothetical protein